MNEVRSKDGALIAFQKSGIGAPLVLVHGTSADHTRWASVLPSLASRFTVYAMDRRGRGGSGDTDPYAIEREFEDVVAVVDSIGELVNLRSSSLTRVSKSIRSPTRRSHSACLRSALRYCCTPGSPS